MAAEDVIEVSGERAQFGSRIGFILAAIGSAVGFGSISRFPMNVANNGGAVFVLLYTVLMVTVGVPIMISEFSLGRAARRNTVGIYTTLEGSPKTPWRFAGYFHWILAAWFLSWYAVVSGWSLRYVFGSMGGTYFGDPNAYLAGVFEGPTALVYMLAVMALVYVVVSGGVSKGIERINLILMPTLFAMIIGLAIYAAFLPNVGPGYAFYLRPDFGAINLGVVTAAIGQAFFSLSLGVGAMMVYASYLSKGTSLASNALLVSLSTLGFAGLCGFLIFPLLSSFGMLESSAGTAGLGLIFGPLAQTFAQMGQPVGNIVGTIFFMAVFFAAFSSAIALSEPAISWAVEEKGLDRRRASLAMVLLMYISAIGPSFSTELTNLEGGKLTDFAVILGGLAVALYVGWWSDGAKARARMDEADAGLRLSWFVYPIVRWVLPFVLVFMLFFAVTGSPCFLSGGAIDQGLIESVAMFFSANDVGPSLLGCRGS